MKWNVLNTRKGKIGFFAVLVILVVGLTVGGTLAFLAANLEATNEFQYVEAACVVTENFERNESTGLMEKSDIKVNIPENTSTTKYMSTYVRVTLVCNWQDSEGNVAAKFDVPTLPADLGEGWVLGSDGYYYYTEALSAGEATTALFDSVITSGTDDGYILSVTVTAEAIQTNSAVTVWGAASSVGTDGTLTVETGAAG